MSAAAVRLPVVAVEDLTSPSDRFACAPFHAIITVRVCLARRGGGRTEDSRNESGRDRAGTGPLEHESYPLCARCALGAEVAARVTSTDQTPRCACGRAVTGANGRVPICRVCRRLRAANASKLARAASAAASTITEDGDGQ